MTTQPGFSRRRAIRLVFGISGVLFIAVGLGRDLLRPGVSDGIGYIQGIVALAGGLMLVAALLGRRTIPAYKGATLMAANTLVALIVLELGAAVILALRPGREPAVPAFMQRLAGLEYYDTTAWGSAFWLEHWDAEGKSRYEPYTGWRARPFDGEFIDIDSSGRRSVPGSDCSRDTPRVAVFGGSAAWGWGSPDRGTIPGHLQADLTRRGIRACVSNHAQNAYVSTQDLIELMKDLQSDMIPAVAVFYGGYNDITGTRMAGRAGIHMMLGRMSARLEAERSSQSAVGIVTDLLRSTKTYQLIRSVDAQADVVEGLDSISGAVPMEVDSVAAKTVRVYETNMQLAHTLAAAHGTDVLFVWQPVLATSGKRLTAEEQVVSDRGADPTAVRRTYELVSSQATRWKGFLFLRDVLDGEAGTMWIDPVHVTPEANRIIAERIAHDVAPLLAGRARADR
ncbi:MAG: hypothetical protein L0271_16030 [Gemmatimonadetes bacterium]|nr:hypothetical protein [Gemmatimonadota bacterium]